MRIWKIPSVMKVGHDRWTIGDIRAPPNEERKLTTEFARRDLAENSTSPNESDRVRVIREGVASYLPDIDPEETAE